MIEITCLQWKQLMEYFARNATGTCQKNSIDGDDCIREYFKNKIVVARMRVFDSNTNKVSINCERKFEADLSLVDMCSGIYIPTQEDWDEFDQMSDAASDEDCQWLKDKGITL